MRFDYIDNLKGIAILLVVAVHFNGFMPIDGVWEKVCKEGASMPQLFFIISAYLLWKSLEKRPIKSLADYGKFLKGRWRRLSPIYYIAILVTVILSLVNGNTLKPGIDYLMHLTYTNGFVPQFTNDVLGVEWYISVLAIFYLIAPMLKKYVANLSNSIYFLLGTMALSGITTNIITPPIGK